MSCTDDDLNALANGDASKFTMRHAAGEILNLRKSIADSITKPANMTDKAWRSVRAMVDMRHMYLNDEGQLKPLVEARAREAAAYKEIGKSREYAEDTRTVLGEIVQTCKELHDTRCTDPDELADEIQWIWTVASAVLARTPSLGPSDPQNSGSSLRNEAATTDSAKAVTNQREGAQCVACGDMYKGGPSVLVCPACLAAYEANRAPGEPGATSTGGAAAAEQSAGSREPAPSPNQPLGVGSAPKWLRDRLQNHAGYQYAQGHRNITTALIFTREEYEELVAPPSQGTRRD